MRFLISLFSLSLASCFPQQEGAIEQELCNPNRDICPGRPITRAAAESMTNDYAYQKELLAGASNPAPHSSCQLDAGHAVCTAWDSINANTYVSTQCDIALDGSSAQCSSIKCVNEQSGTVCHPI